MEAAMVAAAVEAEEMALEAVVVMVVPMVDLGAIRAAAGLSSAPSCLEPQIHAASSQIHSVLQQMMAQLAEMLRHLVRQAAARALVGADCDFRRWQAGGRRGCGADTCNETLSETSRHCRDWPQGPAHLLAPAFCRAAPQRRRR